MTQRKRGKARMSWQKEHVLNQKHSIDYLFDHRYPVFNKLDHRVSKNFKCFLVTKQNTNRTIFRACDESQGISTIYAPSKRLGGKSVMTSPFRTSMSAPSQKASFSGKLLEGVHYYCCCYWCWCCPEGKQEEWEKMPETERGRRPLAQEKARDFGSTQQKHGRSSQATAQPIISRTLSSRPAERLEMKEVPFQMPPLRQTSIVTRAPPTPTIAIQPVQWNRPPQPVHPPRQKTSNGFDPAKTKRSSPIPINEGSTGTGARSRISTGSVSPSHSPTTYQQRSKRNSSVFTTSPAPSITSSAAPSRKESAVEPEYARYLSVASKPSANDEIQITEASSLLSSSRAQSNLDLSWKPPKPAGMRAMSIAQQQTRPAETSTLPSMRKAASQNVLDERDRSDSKRSDASISSAHFSKYTAEDYVHGTLRGILEYDVHNKRVKFTLGKIENLPMRNDEYDVCVRFTIHPSKKEVQKTSRFLSSDAVEKDPGYNEVFQFDCNSPEKKHLMAVVCQPSSTNKHDFIAAGDISFEKIFCGGVHGYSTSIAVQLRRFLTVPELRVGRVLLSLAYESSGGSLTLELIKVQDILMPKGSSDHPTTYVEVIHMRRGTKIQKTHTKTVARQKNPEFQEKLLFKLAREDIDETMFVLILKGKALLKKDLDVGRCYIGPYQYVEGNKLTTYGRATSMHPYKATRWHWFFS